MRRLVIAASLLLPLFFCAPAEASTRCGATATLYSGHADCVRGADQVRNLVSTAADDGYTYKLDPRCKPGDSRVQCQVYAGCTTADGAEGTIYVIWRYDDATGSRTREGTACLTPGEYRSLGTITPAMVRREMQRLSWPKAELDIQPPDGQTLINFDTNFFTSNTDPTTQTVVLLGQQVTIEATPSEYTWHFGDGAATTTTSPGAAYPALDVTYRYGEPGHVRPSVDTTYTGRYRVNGDAWQDIPGSLTVAGESVALRVRSAAPHLVGSPA
jgi:hypothetical protein